METPDIIYVTTTESDDNFVGTAWSKETESCEHVAYVRRDLIEGMIRDMKERIEQEPAEWSEEDEDMAYFVNQFLEYHELSDPTAKSCKKWFNNRFKSLRPVGKESLQPHWKPSEEQMKALDKAIPVCIGVVGRDEVAPLESLYEQLKKLM